MLYEGAATAFARTASFIQVVPLAPGAASLVTAIMSDAALTQFGAMQPHDLTGSSVDQCSPTSLPAITSQSLAAEQLLRHALMSFANPLDSAEQHYVREWAGAITSFDPSAFPGGRHAIDFRLFSSTLSSKCLLPIPHPLWLRSGETANLHNAANNVQVSLTVLSLSLIHI